MDGERLSQDVARKTKLPIAVCNRAIREIAVVIREALGRRERVVIRGLGVWTFSERKERRIYSFPLRAKVTLPRRWRFEFRPHEDIARLDGRLTTVEAAEIRKRFDKLGFAYCRKCGSALKDHDLYILPGPDGVPRPTNRCPK